MSWIDWFIQAFSVKYGRTSMDDPFALSNATYGADKFSHTGQDIMDNAFGDSSCLPRTCGTRNWSASGGLSSATGGPGSGRASRRSDMLCPEGNTSLSLVGRLVDGVCLRRFGSVLRCRSLRMVSGTSERFSSRPGPHVCGEPDSNSGRR